MAFAVLLHLVVLKDPVALKVPEDPWVLMWVDLTVLALDCFENQVSVVLNPVVRSYMVLGDLEDLLPGDLLVLGVPGVLLEPFEGDLEVQLLI